MLLKEVIEIIEFTDTDSFSEALDIFNKNGILFASMLPLLDVVFDVAPQQLCHKLKDIGFKGSIEVVKINKNNKSDYVIYDSHQFRISDVEQWVALDNNR